MSEDTTKQTIEVIERFNEATGRRDVDGMMSFMSGDVFFDDTNPPDGKSYSGQAAVRARWEALFSDSPRAHFATEELFAHGDRCTVRWRYTFDADAPDSGHIRGVDVFTVRDGKITEKRSYVKG